MIELEHYRIMDKFTCGQKSLKQKHMKQSEESELNLKNGHQQNIMSAAFLCLF